MIIVVLRDPRTERPVPDYIQKLWDAFQDHENKIASLQAQQKRMDDLMVDYQTAAENAERALGLVPQLADKIDALRDAIASNSGVPQAVQDAADALDVAAQEALTEAQAALADPPSAQTPPDTTGPSAPADPGTSPPADPATSETPAPGVDPGAPVVSDPNPDPAVPDPETPPVGDATGPDGGADANASTPSPGAPEPGVPSAAAGEGDASVQDPAGANGP